MAKKEKNSVNKSRASGPFEITSFTALFNFSTTSSPANLRIKFNRRSLDIISILFLI